MISGPQPFLAPGTGFVEDNFSTDGVRGMAQAVMRAMGSDGERQMKLPLLAHLLCGPVPNRPRPQGLETP